MLLHQTFRLLKENHEKTPIPNSSIPLNLIEIDAVSPLPRISTNPSFDTVPTTSPNSLQLNPPPSIETDPDAPSTSSSSVVGHVPGIAKSANKTQGPKQLRIIPPKKTIFATRFAYDTSAKDVEYYIQTKLSTDVSKDIQVYRINVRNRASFKIIVPEDLFDQIVDLSFWPKNTLVRQFIYRDDDNVHLPKANNLNNNSKN